MRHVTRNQEQLRESLLHKQFGSKKYQKQLQDNLKALYEINKLDRNIKVAC